jgi:formylmethanofuran dehydrogenase subunit A
LGVDFIMKKYIQRKEYDTTQVDDEWIILNTEDYTVTTLNQMGGLCWSLVKEPATVDSIIQEVQTHYLLPNKPIKDDIETFLSEMIKLGLVQYAS